MGYGLGRSPFFV